MNRVSSVQVLRLYKDLLRYGQQLKYSDRLYFSNRIKTEFRKNKIISEPEKIKFNFERGSMLQSNFIRYNFVSIRQKVNIDYSKVPVLLNEEVEEKFVRGAGPGGQKINKTASAVFLKHLPTGISVKCQQSRSLDQNRKTARILLTTKLDNILNGEYSIEHQKREIESKKKLKMNRKKNKMKEMKEEWLKQKNGKVVEENSANE